MIPILLVDDDPDMLDLMELRVSSFYRDQTAGGVVRDLPEGVLDKIKGLVFDRLPAKTDEMANRRSSGSNRLKDMRAP